MPRAAIVYGTTEGQTAKIAAHMADVGRHAGVEVDVLHAAELDEDSPLEAYDGVLVGGSLHEGRMQRYLRRWTHAHGQWLSDHPSGLFCVCLTAAGTDETARADAERILGDFAAGCDFTPRYRTLIAGALRYTQYSWFKRVIMKHIAAQAGGSTDTDHDHEYTDWDAVTAWVTPFFESLTKAATARQPSGA